MAAVLWSTAPVGAQELPRRFEAAERAAILERALPAAPADTARATLGDLATRYVWTATGSLIGFAAGIGIAQQTASPEWALPGLVLGAGVSVIGTRMGLITAERSDETVNVGTGTWGAAIGMVPGVLLAAVIADGSGNEGLAFLAGYAAVQAFFATLFSTVPP